MSYRRPMLISLAVHALPLLLLISFGSSGGSEGDSEQGNKEGNNTVKVTLLDKSSDIGQKDPCPNWYGGIGVTTSGGRVQSVAKGHIAHRSGVLVGDAIITPIESIKGEVGTKIRIEILRNSKIIVLDLVREKICTLGR